MDINMNDHLRIKEDYLKQANKLIENIESLLDKLKTKIILISELQILVEYDKKVIQPSIDVYYDNIDHAWEIINDQLPDSKERYDDVMKDIKKYEEEYPTVRSPRRAKLPESI